MPDHNETLSDKWLDGGIFGGRQEQILEMELFPSSFKWRLSLTPVTSLSM
ncbi:hypothetical protein KKI95_15670 [Xenorhabdus bovienii]|nr:hypothetical protein [Xenorhabdus bovienii]MDE1475623.1 hypothetical protein [Xenorhabdus bovienii]MDE9429323.1 hypothetical protein [Xenorhabdus bovienii]MDE9437325.1 hypothetical protein [Xenorhabdus bovienii]MDE9442800.1 hypothetical protein [Xenorhabdus bovienii]MDE9457300.1 hypothetical protein [Xenorhabdus bovienii]